MSCLHVQPDDTCESPKTVVRLKTCAWKDKRSINIKRTITLLSSKSIGPRLIWDDEGVGLIIDDPKAITNLDECEDGVYEVAVCNVHTDWETGTETEYDYKLVPVEGE